MTKTSKIMKRILSLLAVVIILCSITIAPANAIWNPFDYQRNRAFIAAALTAMNIMFESQIMNVASQVEYIADPAEVVYSYTDMWSDRPTIQIWDDYVTIDGVNYTDIWISNEAAEKFRVNGRDFITAYNIASNSNGIFKQGIGTADGIPLYGTAQTAQSQNYYANGYGRYSIGDGYGVVTNSGGSLRPYQMAYELSTGVQYNGTTTADSKVKYYAWKTSAYQIPKITMSGSDGRTSTIDVPSALYDNTPFDYSWVSTDIPADVALPSDTGMMIRVPTNQDITDFVTDNPEFNQPGGTVIDVNVDPDIMNKLGDLIDLVIPIIPMINNNLGGVTFVENHNSPAPVQDTLLPDTWWSTVEHKLDNIIQTISNIPSQIPQFNPASIIQEIQTIPSAISQGVSNITQSISNLGDTILRDIEEGPIRLLDKLIDVLRNLFFPILATLRGFLGIWHYVVTWMSNISAPFTWIMGLMAGTSSILVSPIYALIAGTIVIAVYRRFGR